MSEADLPPGWPAMSIAQAHALLTAPGMPTRDRRGRDPRRPDQGLEERAADAARGRRGVARPRRDASSWSTRTSGSPSRPSTAPWPRSPRELRAEGVGKGDRVAVIMRNLPEWPVAFYAAASLGAIVTPLNAWWTGPELEYGLTDSGAKVAIVDAERWSGCAEHLAQLPGPRRASTSRRAARRDRPPAGHQAGGRDRRRRTTGRTCPTGRCPTSTLGPEDDATIFYTSGTTGKPKGALGTQRNINSNIMAGGIAAARALPARAASRRRRPIRRRAAARPR